jgi:asparagine synthase (glutamine-hydrolysing)
MCGIAGVLTGRGAEAPDFEEMLGAMSRVLAARGPDAEGLWVARSRAVGFAHRRLSIIDVSTRSDQPLHSTDGRYSIVFNGEIYNYQELRDELRGRGRQFVTSGDTEVLLQGWAEYGPEILTRLRGMYAFGIWDEEKQELFLARDPYGIKPLYYAEAGGHLCFASQVKALRPVPGVDLREEPAGHVGFFVWGSVPEPWTLFRGIHCLPSGSWLRATRDGVPETRRFDSPVEAFRKFAPKDMPKSEGESDERVHAALEDSVRAHQIADVPVAIFLSAGIDSSMVAALVAEEHHDLEALTLGFDKLQGTPADETGAATQVAQWYGVRQHCRFIGQEMFLAHRERLLEQMDQPSIDGVNTYLISWLARERGFKVAISGLGGDEMFGGYPSFRDIPSTVHKLRPANAVPWLGRGWRVVSSAAIARFTSPKYASLLEYGGTWGGAYLLRRALFMPWELPKFMDAELVRTGWRDLGSLEQMNALARSVDKLPGAEGPQVDFLKVAALETSSFLRSQLLRDSDWAGMAHSVEIRVPLVDMELLRQLAPLRASRFAPRKPLVARCLAKPLPPEIMNRKKSGFTVPVREWMQQDTPGRGLRQWAQYVYRNVYRGALPAMESPAMAH